MITWQDLHHAELSAAVRFATAALRGFVVEQTCPYQDVDGDDLIGENRHLLGWRGMNWWPTRAF
jgi:ElaA protein